LPITTNIAEDKFHDWKLEIMPTQENTITPIRPLRFKNAKNGRLRGTPTTAKVTNKLQQRLIIFMIIAVVIGFGVGYLVKRQKDNSQKVIAAVNGKLITEDQLFAAMQAVDGPTTIHKLVQDQVQLQFAERLGLVPTKDQVVQQLTFLEHQPNFDLIIRNSGLSSEDFAYNLQLQMAQEAVFSQGLTVSDSELAQFYQTQSDPNNPKSLFYRPPVSTLQCLATHDRQSVEAALAEINSGVPFEIVAGNVSQDASKVNGGRLNPIMLGQSALSRTPDVEQQIFSLRVGQISGPIYFQKSWWIFKCNEYAPPVQIPFNDVAIQARQEALAAKGLILNGAKVRQEFADYMKSSQIQAFWPQYKRAIETP
jgi:hypothetical protein